MTTPPHSCQMRAGGAYFLVLGNNGNKQETLHHLPPASRATAHGMEAGSDDGSEGMVMMQTHSVNPCRFLYLCDPLEPIPIPVHTYTHECGC